MRRGVWIAGGGLATAAGVGLWFATRPAPSVPPSAPLPSPVAEEARPNVLFIVWDTTRADRMSVYGYDRPTTPRLEAFAENAVVYEQARSPGIWTLPAHASMFTGMPPESTGAGERWMWLDGHHLTVSEHFGASGYDTFSFAANTLLSSDTNLVQGFEDHWNTFRGERIKKMALQATKEKVLPQDKSNELAPGWRPPDHGATNAEWARAVYKEAGPIVGEGLLRWIDTLKDPQRPFFAYLNMMEAHTPRIPSMEARKQVMNDPALIDLGLATDAAHINLHFYNFGKHDYSARELEAIGGVYDATLVDLDNATADLFAGLQSRGILDNTIVVLTSDHGENLGDHHLFNHRLAMYDTLLHVPLIIRYPARLAPARVSEPVSTVDLFATLIDLAGVPEVPELVSQSLLAPDRAPVSYMEVPLEREIRTVQRVHPDVAVEPWLRMGHSAVQDGWKLIRYSNGAHELYDLAADPGEENNLYGTQPERERQLEARIADWTAAAPAYDPSLRTEDPRTLRANQDDLINQLKALGYAAGDTDE